MDGDPVSVRDWTWAVLIERGGAELPSAGGGGLRLPSFDTGRRGTTIENMEAIEGCCRLATATGGGGAKA